MGARRVLLGLLLIGLTGWGSTAIYYSNLPAGVRPIAALLLAVLVATLLVVVRPHRRAVLSVLTVFVLLIAWWLSIPASNDRNWKPDVALLPWAVIEGNQVTLHDIRNCEYRSESDFTVRHYDKTLQLDQLRTADLSLVYWGSPSIAHTMMSFGFADGSYVCFSIETRNEMGEGFSTVKGFFKQYELTYVVADERDVLRLRTNFRHEDVYLYRMSASEDRVRYIFLDYLREVNQLKAAPEWYNAMTSNCTTNIRSHTAPGSSVDKLDWRILINGYVDELAYERKALDQSLPFPELKRRSHVNEAALAAGDSADFSKLIRQGLPGFAR